MPVSQSQLQKLGKRLKEGVTASDLRLLDDYRRSFLSASAAVAIAVHEATGFEASQRPAKSTQAILEKLRRQATHLGKIQDIAGCRITVPDMAAQDAALHALQERFPGSALKDRRDVPSHGYRAVHLVVKQDAWRIEIQIRTALQNRWALLSERMADRFGNDVKYGGGPTEIRGLLEDAAQCVAELEHFELEFAQLGDLMPRKAVVNASAVGHSTTRFEERLTRSRQRLIELMLNVPERLEI